MHQVLSLNGRELVIDNVTQVLTIRLDKLGQPVALRIYQRGAQVMSIRLDSWRGKDEAWADAMKLEAEDFNHKVWLALRTTIMA